MSAEPEILRLWERTFNGFLYKRDRRLELEQLARLALDLDRQLKEAKGEAMSTDPVYWYQAGRQDRQAGNDKPGVTSEDFHRDIEDEAVAQACWDAYRRGFFGESSV